jgi:hypothetical protein
LVLLKKAMGRYIIIPILLISVWSCKQETGTTYMTAERALYYFDAIGAICREDAGDLWGEDLYGPIMFVDRKTRRIIANAQDSEKLLKLKDGVYIGSYPKEKLIDIIAFEFGGTLFGTVRLPDIEDEYVIKAYAIHSRVHCMQQKKGISPQSYNNRHLSERNARMWLKLEWKALSSAISSEGEERRLAIRDALIFRGARHEAYPAYVNDERRFENYEGLPTFSYTLLCTASREEQKNRLLEGIKFYYSRNTYHSTYGFIHGALYAYLLYDKGFRPAMLTTDNADLGRLTSEYYSITMPEVIRDVAGSIAINYSIDIIRQEETEREQRIKEEVAKKLSVYTERPVVFLDLESPSFGFEPTDPSSLDTLGTIYKSLRVSDNWGKLIVNETGCLVSHNLKEIRIPAKGIKTGKSHITGEGWDLWLADTWELVKSDQNYNIRKITPRPEF